MVSSRLFIASTTAITLVSLITLSSSVNAHPFPMERDFEEPKSLSKPLWVKKNVKDNDMESALYGVFLPNGLREQVVCASTPLTKKCRNATHVKNMMRGVAMFFKNASISQQEIEQVISQAAPLIKAGVFKEEVSEILEVVASIPFDQRSETINLLLPLSRYNNNNLLLKTYFSFPPQERKDIVELVKPVIGEDETFSPYSIRSILEDVASIPDKERKVTISLVKPLYMQDVGGNIISFILKAVKSLPIEERGERLKALALLQRRVQVCPNLVRTVNSIPAQELIQTITATNPLITQKHLGIDISYILEAYQSIPAEEREEIIHDYQTISEGMRNKASGPDVSNAIAILQRAPHQDRLSYIEQANEEEKRNVFHYLKYLDSIVPVPDKKLDYVKVEEILDSLNKNDSSVNFQTVRKIQPVELPKVNSKNESTVVEDFEKLMDMFDLNDPALETYLGYSAITGESLDLHMSNEIGVRALIARVRGFVKTLFDLPVDESKGESEGWQMYENAKPAMRHAIQAILGTLLEAAPNQRMQGVVMLFNGLLHCPTGQKEGIDAIVQGLFCNELRRNDVPSRLLQLIGNFRDNQFSTMILESAPNNSQNTHMLSFYKEMLAPILGTQTTLKGFSERLGTFNDPFEKDALKPLELFVEKIFTPDTLVEFFLSRVQTKNDLLMIQEISDLEKKIDKIVPKEPKKIQEEIIKIEKVILTSQEELNTLENENPQNQAIGQKKMVLDLRKKRLETLKTSLVSEEEYRQKVKEREQQVTRLKQLKAELKKITTFERPFSVLDLYNYMKEEIAFSPSWFKLQTLDTDIEVPVALTKEGAIALLERVGLFTDKRNTDPTASGKEEVE